MNHKDDKYLDDPEIHQLLDDIEVNMKRLREKRDVNDYMGVCYYAGTIRGMIERIYTRNSQIDRVPPETMGN